MKKLLLLAAAIAAVLVGLYWLPDPSPDHDLGQGPGGAVEKPAAAKAAEADTAGTDERQEIRKEVPDAPATGAARVRCTWESDGTPACGVTVWCYGVRDKRTISVTSARTDPHGVVTFSDLPSGSYRFWTGSGRGKADVPGGDVVNVELSLTVFVKLRGIVVDVREQPIAGASVELFGYHLPHVVATSGTDGRFQARVAGRGSVWARKPGWQPSALHALTTKGTRDLVLVLPDGGHLLTGIVLDPPGDAVSGAVVAIPLEKGKTILLETDKGGRFRTQEVPAGTRTVYARSEGLAFGQTDVEIPVGSSANAVVRLRRGATVHGAGRDRKGRALPYIDVLAHREQPLPGLSRDISDLFTRSETKSDAEGRFRLTGVNPGRMWLAALGREFTRTKSVVFKDGQTFEWNPVKFPPGDLSIRGVLVGPRTGKLVGWRVGTSHVDLKEMKPESAEATTDAQGRFELRNLRDIPYELKAYLPGKRLTAAVRENVRPGLAEFVWQIPFLPEDCGGIVGRILDPDGEPMPRVKLSARHAGVSREATFAGDVPGGFRIQNVPPGTWTLHGWRPEYGSFELGQHGVRPKSVTDIGTVRLGKPGWLLVRLHQGEQAPARLMLRLAQANGGRNKTKDFTTTKNGARRSAPLPPGRYQLHVFGEDIALVEREVTIEAGRETGLDVELERAATVQVCFVPEELLQEQWRDWVFIDLFDGDGRKILHEVLTVKKGTSYTWRIGLKPGAYEVRAASYQLARRRGQARFRVPEESAEPLRVGVKLAVQR